MIEPNNNLNAIFNKTAAMTKKMRHKFITLEHLLYQIMCDKESYAILEDIGADSNYIKSNMEYYLKHDFAEISAETNYTPIRTRAVDRVLDRCIRKNLSEGRTNVEVLDVISSLLHEKESYCYYFLTKGKVSKDTINEITESFSPSIKPDERGRPQPANKESKVLTQYCTNLSELAANDKLDPLIGREVELEKLQLVLARRQKNNVILVSGAGCGKNNLVEGLVKRIHDKKVPKFLQDHVVYSLDVSTVLAGTKYRGDFEDRIKNIFAALEQIQKVVLFIDEAHMMNGAGSSTNSANDMANMIKPMLAKSKIKVIAATTWEEYRKHFEGDRALVRRFQKVVLDEPTPELAVSILKGLKRHYEKHHNVKVTEEAIEHAVSLSVKYIADRLLPDKALDVIDCACARFTVNDAVAKRVVDGKKILYEVSQMCGVPIDTMNAKNVDSLVKPLASVEEGIKKVLFGQDSAVDQLLDKIFIAQAGMKHPNKPIGCFLLQGITGSGKTECAKTLADKMGMTLIRFDMSEYQEKHSVAKFIGTQTYQT